MVLEKVRCTFSIIYSSLLVGGNSFFNKSYLKNAIKMTFFGQDLKAAFFNDIEWEVRGVQRKESYY